MGSRTPGTEPESALLHRYEEIGRSETIYAVFELKTLIIEVYRSDTESCIKEVVDMPHCEDFDIENFIISLELWHYEMRWWKKSPVDRLKSQDL